MPKNERNQKYKGFICKLRQRINNEVSIHKKKSDVIATLLKNEKIKKFSVRGE